MSRALAWLALGLTALGLAFTVHPIHTSHAVFVVVLAGGGAMLLVGVYEMARDLIANRRNAHEHSERMLLLMRDCNRLSDDLAGMVSDAEHGRPRQGPWPRGGTREDDWRLAVTSKYRDSYRILALQLFDDAVAFRVVSSNYRLLIEAPSADQLRAVRDLFREIAQDLGRATNGARR